MGRSHPPRWCLLLIGLGLYLTCRGYHSRDGDQAYRLPLLLHQQDPALFADDPFVRSFDAFNPHRGFFTLLDAASRPLGLSFGLAILFASTFGLTVFGLDRLARSVWPESGPWVGVVAATLVMAAKAGNIGTNHLFEAMLLDRLIALALGWVALAEVVARQSRSAWTVPPLLGVAAWIHPSVGLQLALWIGSVWVGFAAHRALGEIRPTRVGLALVFLALALTPSLLAMAAQSPALLRGMDRSDFYTWTAKVQSPQHMLPHLWRMPQWLAAASYLAMAGLILADSRPCPASRRRLATLLSVNLAGLVVAWAIIEGLHDLRITLFQPFRMATPARGLCLVLVAGRLTRLWREDRAFGRPRAVLLAVGLSGDWSMVAATAVELAFVLGSRRSERFARLAGLATFAAVLVFLARHDTESGQFRLLAAFALGLLATRLPRTLSIDWHPRRLAQLGAVAWVVPIAALILPILRSDRAPGWVARLAEHCRFTERPVDAVERLALWCREHTPADARFIGPPGPKTFRLWSRRSLAFNRAGSPYHATGLADWAARFQDHVGFEGPPAAFARAYLDDRQALERRFDAMPPGELADLATRQGASYVLASATLSSDQDGPLERLRTDGRYAIYRVRGVLSDAPRDSEDHPQISQIHAD